MIITKDQIKAHLGITGTADDAVLDLYIGQIGDFLKTKIGRVIEETEIVELFDGDNLKDEIFLGNYPITQFTSLQYRGGSFSSPVWRDFSDNDFLVDPEDGTIQIQATYSGLKNIKATYKAGYVIDETGNDVPKALQLAALKLVAKVFNKRRSDGFSSEEVAGARVEWDKFLSDDIKELINPFRRMPI